MHEIWNARNTDGLFIATSNNEGIHYHPLPSRIWSTKSHEYWVLLGVLLHCIKPESILELGAGRSSVYLSEYAGKKGKAYVSVDDNEKWLTVHRFVARFGGLDNFYFHLVPLDENDFYNEKQVIKLVDKTPDFIYLDGPNKNRNGLIKNKKLLGLCEQANTIIIDDIQWRHVYDQMEMFKTLGIVRKATVIGYRSEKITQYVCILVREDLQHVLDGLLQALNIRPVAGYSRSRCVED